MTETCRCIPEKHWSFPCREGRYCLFCALVFHDVARLTISNESRHAGRGLEFHGLPLSRRKFSCDFFLCLQFSDIAAVSYPDTYGRFLNSVAVFNLNLSWMISPGCIVRNNFYHRLLMDTIGPIIVTGILAVTYMVAVTRAKRLISRFDRSTDGTAAMDGAANAKDLLVGAIQNIRRRHLSAVLLVTFVVYSSVSSAVFKTFACDDLDNSRSYLRADHSLVCYDGNHKLAMAYAGIMVIVYPLGIPFLYASFLYSGRKVLTTDSRANHPEVSVKVMAKVWTKPRSWASLDGPRGSSRTREISRLYRLEHFTCCGLIWKRSE